jgi:hypothetical protein
MTIQVNSANDIIMDGHKTKLKLVQLQEKTCVYTPESQISGTEYQEHDLPHARYSLTHAIPHGGSAGVDDLAGDIRALLSVLAQRLAVKNNWYAKFINGSWVPCDSTDQKAVLDVNRAIDKFYD